MSRASQPIGDVEPAHPQDALDFEAERDAVTTSWERADPTEALIERWGRYGYLVTLLGGDAHFCAIGRRRDGEFIGWCRCKGYRYHDGPCAHLCTVRKAAFGDLEAVNGEPVEIAHAVECDDMVDAEHTAGQQTGEVFEASDAQDIAKREERNHGRESDASDDADDAREPGGRLADMTPSEREVFLAVEYRDLTPTEAAEETNRDPSTARTLLHRARKKDPRQEGPA